MELNRRLFEIFADRAQKIKVDFLCLGLGYTAVTTSDGGIGLAYTFFENKENCSLVGRYVDFENLAAIELLKLIKSDDPLERCMALALINALNYKQALALPEDRNNETLMSRFDIHAKTRVAMVGLFDPLVKIFEARQVEVEVIDEFRGRGKKDAFYTRLADWADVLILTSTAILNNTVEEILNHAGKQLKTVLLGPSTPMVPDAFAHLPVDMLAGAVPLNQTKVLKAVRHGTGARALNLHGKKVCWVKSDGAFGA